MTKSWLWGSQITVKKSEPTTLEEKVSEQAKKIHELAKNIEEQVNRNSRETLVKRDILKGKIKKNNGIIIHMYYPHVLMDYKDGQNI